VDVFDEIWNKVRMHTQVPTACAPWQSCFLHADASPVPES